MKRLNSQAVRGMTIRQRQATKKVAPGWYTHTHTHIHTGPLVHLVDPVLVRWRLAAVAATTPVTVEAHASQNHWHTNGTPEVWSMGMSTSDAVTRHDRSRSSW